MKQQQEAAGLDQTLEREGLEAMTEKKAITKQQSLFRV